MPVRYVIGVVKAMRPNAAAAECHIDTARLVWYSMDAATTDGD